MTPGEKRAQERFLSGRAESLGAQHAHEDVYRALAPPEQQSFQIAWTASQNDGAHSPAIASGTTLGGVAALEGLPDPSGDSWYLAWGKGLMYGAHYRRGPGESVKNQPSFIAAADIEAIHRTNSQGLDRLHFVTHGGQESFFFTLTPGSRLRAEELAELLGVPLNEGEPTHVMARIEEPATNSAAARTSASARHHLSL